MLLLAIPVGLVTLCGLQPALAQCDYYQYVAPGVFYDLESPGYPQPYPPGSRCRWQAVADADTRLRLSCGLFQLPPSTDCVIDRVRISLTGDVGLSDAHVFCGQGTFQLTSENNRLNMVLEASFSSEGGRFLCNITAVAPGCVCGIKKQTRIVGGTETGVNEYPMMAGLVDYNSRSIYCGATIVSEHFVVTAAHCVVAREVATMAVVVGEHNVTTGSETNATRVYLVGDVVVHARYDPMSQENDIALVRVRGTIPVSSDVMPACLPFFYQQRDFTDATVLVLGWGTTSFGGSMSSVLMKADLSVISNTDCVRAMGSSVTPRQVCTFASGKDACQSDSGGPVLWQDPNKGFLYVLGVISYGISCATDSPGVNTRVTSYLNWIDMHVDDRLCYV